MDFLFHNVTEKEKIAIQKQAKGIIDNFSRKLSKIKTNVDFDIEREKGERDEVEGKTDENFSRDVMFKNAPDKNNDSIIAEKGKW
jgi:Asp-tRNA(Asn)/Glu-tRNA(Gln) amidotransferase C subunit